MYHKDIDFGVSDSVVEIPKSGDFGVQHQLYPLWCVSFKNMHGGTKILIGILLAGLYAR
jgi:hypothetical protein